MGQSGHFYSFLSVCGPGVVGVKCWDRLPCYWDMLYFGRAPPYKGDSARFSLNPESWRKGLNEVVSGYPTSMNIRRVDGLSTDPRETCKKI